MAYEDEKRRAAQAAAGQGAGTVPRSLPASGTPQTYAEEVQNSPGMRLLRGIGGAYRDMKAYRDANMAAGARAYDQAQATARQRAGIATPAAATQKPAPIASPAAAKPATATPTAAVPAPTAAPPPAAPPTVNRNFNLKPGDKNTFTFSDGRTVAVPGLLDAGVQPAAAGGFQRGLGGGQQVQYREAQAPGGAMGANIAAMTDDQKAQMRQDDFRWAMRGANTRSARAAIADAYVAGEQVRGAERRADIEARSAENIAAGRNATDIARTNAEGQLGAQRINADLANSAADRDNRLEEARITRRLQPTMLEDGTIGQIGDNGTFTPITDAAGKPVRGAQSARQTGDLTASDLLKSYDTRRAAIETSLADDAVKQQQLAALDADPMYASLRGTSQAGTQPATEDDFVRQAVAAGHDPEKARAFWRNKQKGSQQQ